MLSFEEIRRRKMIQVSVVYAVTAWLIIQVIIAIEEPLNLPQWSDTLVIVLLGSGFPIVLIVTWVFNVTRHGLVRDEGVLIKPSHSLFSIELILLFVITIAVSWLFYRTEFDTTNLVEKASPDDSKFELLQHSIAVLPFENLNQDPTDTNFAAGLHEEVLKRLAGLSHLSVISRTSVKQYKGSRRTIPEIANELNVGAVLEGSIQYVDGQLRIHAQLIDAATDMHIWSNSYEQEYGDILAIESEIASSIANAIQTEFSLNEQTNLSQRSLKASNASLTSMDSTACILRHVTI